MRNIIDPFLYNVEHLDIHGFERTGARAVIKNFIDESVRMGRTKIIVVHGKGTGILKKTTHEYLRQDSRVLSFKTNNYNDGETIINLKER